MSNFGKRVKPLHVTPKRETTTPTVPSTPTKEPIKTPVPV